VLRAGGTALLAQTALAAVLVGVTAQQTALVAQQGLAGLGPRTRSRRGALLALVAVAVVVGREAVQATVVQAARRVTTAAVAVAARVRLPVRRVTAAMARRACSSSPTP